MDKKIAVLTGGTSGIGMQTALALKSAGYTVYELSRRAQGVEGLNHLVADVTDEAAVKKAVDEIVAREGKIDVSSTTRASASRAQLSSQRPRTPSAFLTRTFSAW